MKIRKGDKVIVIAGKDKGLVGKVLHAYPKIESLIVEGVNMKKRHRRPTKSGQHGQIIDKANPIHISNVQLVDPKENKPTRVRYEYKKGKKVRVAVKSKTELAS